MYERTVVINGFSKGAAMTGFRLGYLAAPLELTKACAKVQGNNTSCPCSLSQWAALAALTKTPPSFLTESIANFRSKVIRLHATLFPICRPPFFPYVRN